VDDLATVTALLERWRDAGRLERVRVGVEAARAIGDLSPGRKRALAVEVASRVAPQLVPQIRDEEGDLTSEQVQAVVDLLRRADRDQLDDLVAALRSGDTSAALRLADETLDTLAPPTHHDTSDASVDDPGSDDGAASAVGAVGVAAGVAAGVAPSAGPPAGAADPSDATVPPTRQDDAPAPDAVEIDIDEEQVRAELRAEASAAREQWRETSPPPATMVPIDVDFDVSFALNDDESVESDAGIDPLTDDTDVQAALPDVTAPTGVGTSPTPPTIDAVPDDGPEVVRDLLAVPDGYRRRRAVLAAVRDGTLRSSRSIAALVPRFDRTTDRDWVAGAALDAGLLGPDDLDALPLGAGARRRLQARLERRPA
jgi:hypothetical protein